jgi:nodulation protein E
MQRVVATGIGVVSPLGPGVDQFWTGLVQPRAGIGPITLISTDKLNVRIAAEIKDFDPAAHFPEKRAGLMDRFAQFAVVAARSAVADARLKITEALALETAVVIGTGIGGHATLDESYLKVYGQGAQRVHPFTIPRLMANAGASHVSMDLGIKGPTWTVSTACASGSHAIGQAFQMVRNGQAPIALCGGAEAPITFGSIKGWEALRVLTSDTCRPFSKSRSGMVLGEGAAILVLESYEHAVARGAPIYAEVSGFGCGADAGDVTSIDPAGGVRAVRAALRDARTNPDDVDYVNAHGTGTDMNDRAEAQVLYSVFGPRAARLPVSSSKAVLGHSLGGSGAMEFAATVLALKNQVIPPTANFEEADPSCALDCVPNVARAVRIETAVSNSFAFGGLNAVLVARRV